MSMYIMHIGIGCQSALCVDVTGGQDSSFSVVFRPYEPGDAPVRIDNLCDDLHIKLFQK